MRNTRKFLSLAIAFIFSLGLFVSPGMYYIASAASSADYNKDVVLELPYEHDFEAIGWQLKYQEGLTDGNPVVDEFGIEKSPLGYFNPYGWITQNYKSGFVWAYLAKVDEAHGYSLQLWGNGGDSSNLQATIDFNNYGDLNDINSDYMILEFDARAEDTKVRKNYQLRGSNTNQWVDVISFEAGGEIKIGGKSTGRTYEPKRWYHVKTFIDQVNDKYIVYLDDQRLEPTINLPTGWDKIRFFYFSFSASTAGADAMYVDNIKLDAYTLPEFTVNEQMTYPANGSTDVSVDTELYVSFTNEIDASSLFVDQVLVNGELGWVKSIVLDPFDSTMCVISFYGPLDPFTEYSVSISNVKDIFGQTMAEMTSPITFTTGQGDGTEYVISEPAFIKVEGAEESAITQLQSGQIKSRVRIRNINSEDSDVLVTTALYKNNELIEIDMKQLNIDSATTLFVDSKEFSLSDAELDAYTIKVFVWNLVDGMKPMKDPTSISSESNN